MRGAHQPLEANRARTEAMGGKRWSGEGTKKEGRDRGRVKSAIKETAVMSWPVKNQRVVLSSLTPSSQGEMSLCAQSNSITTPRFT